ncbi:Adenylate cyclase 1 [Phaeobacter sp. CECT 5382]|uniref:adenylate/guanylate cyclase domain-containing protein n=1 Tax=Phaeobacter sp. CECT 5382 TaxID=1712645 RepID=UPI0006D9433E|nr:adenylate/guanylate cyclase domain-containing protein [Phaeobacter sp. CECT 5382]CUH89314.1 Adenylate cyclase 1 [Phaeobacter sp. CECT 5382]
MLWQGNWITRTRIISGLILFAFAFFHFINLGLGLISTDTMERMQDVRHMITRTPLGGLVLTGALITHLGLALWRLALRRSLRMPLSQAVQTALGLLIPLQLLRHITHTTVAHQNFAVNDTYPYVIVLMWNAPAVWWQSALLLVVWVHGCMGLHFWLRLTDWWRNALPYMIGLAVFIPSFALAGLLTEGRRIYDIFVEGTERAALMASYNWPSQDSFASLQLVETRLVQIFVFFLFLTAMIYGLRKLLRRRRSVRITYRNGPIVVAEKGMTLLEMSRANAIPHTALCGGKGRCTTCRVVIEDGADTLPPPSDAEARSLAAVRAPQNMRLACQIHPNAPLSVCRLFRPDGQKGRAHASQGEERQLAILFLDMRGFTARTSGQLPYDVVFLLNRFFDAIVPCILNNGGTVDKYLGDGLLAVFEAPDAVKSAQAGLHAVTDIGRAVADFNETLLSEGEAPVRIGMGLHLGEVVIGEIGSSGNAPRTIIGDTVNAASRLEAQTKELGVELLVSAQALLAAGYDTQKLGLRDFQLRGVSAPLAALPVRQTMELPEILDVPGH